MSLADIMKIQIHAMNNNLNSSTKSIAISMYQK